MEEMQTTERPPKPEVMPVAAENVPAVLAERKQWVGWRWEWNGRKFDKPPRAIADGKKFNDGNPVRLATFDEALAAQRSGRYDGIGFRFLESDPFCGVDVDDCRDENGEPSDFAKEILVNVQTYTEVSPSGNGYKAFAIGKIPPGSKADHDIGLEMYSEGRYFTVTGRRVDWLPESVHDRQHEIELYHGLYLEKKQQPTAPVPKSETDDRSLSLDALAALGSHRADGHSDWIAVGMALHSVDESLLPEWDQWSQQSEKYDAADCAQRWKSFHAGGKIKLGSLVHWAQQDGWTPPWQRNSHAVGTLVPNSTTSPRSYRMTDVGNALRLVDNHGDEVRYCHPWKKWLVWDRCRWALDESGAIVRRATNTVAGIYGEASAIEDEKDRKALIRFALASEKRERLRAMIGLAESRDGVPVSPADLDTNGWLLNCPNGTVELKSGKLRPHQQRDLITKVCPVEYHPDSRCPQWSKALSVIFGGDGELVSYFQRAMGMSIVGEVRDEALFIPYGSGSNGKSLILGTIQDVLGEDFAMKAPPDLLMKRRGESHPTERADLYGKRLVLAIETEDGSRLSESLIKELTGGDKIRARRMREDFWEFAPTHTLWLAVNHLPNVKGTDDGIWRRLRVIPFVQQFWNPDTGDMGAPELKADKGLKDKLRAERSGILAWLIRGCLDWQKHGLGEPPKVHAATGRYRGVMDTLGTFISECCDVDSEAEVSASELYAVYRSWMDNNGERPETQKRFGMAMTERGFERSRQTIGVNKGRKIYQGITLLGKWSQAPRENEREAREEEEIGQGDIPFSERR